MKNTTLYDLAIIGGGLGGLCLAISLAKKSFRVVLFEKETYPFHKVCGEYISQESRPFLESLGVPLPEMQLPQITRLQVSSPSGNVLEEKLPLGGFGVSRYLLDNTLCRIARENGVDILEDTKVQDVNFENDIFTINTTQGDFTSRTCAGAFGKRSNLDVKWKRPFTINMKGRLQNYIAVKYHVNYEQPADTISLHNFQDGYCGISHIEEGKCCLCYLTTSANLKKSGNSIADMETKILSANPLLKNIFKKGEKLYEVPLTISQVSFRKKNQVENHILLLGDAAGMITPLCGNGMSMAMHAAKIAAGNLEKFLHGRQTRRDMEEKYTMQWKSAFGTRLKTGRFLQRLFGDATITNMFVSSMKKFPAITRRLIKLTHGNPF
ncbi:MAG: NAD(P)-binding protein [Ferruginibacter sp.]